LRPTLRNIRWWIAARLVLQPQFISPHPLISGMVILVPHIWTIGPRLVLQPHFIPPHLLMLRIVICALHFGLWAGELLHASYASLILFPVHMNVWHSDPHPTLLDYCSSPRIAASFYFPAPINVWHREPRPTLLEYELVYCSPPRIAASFISPHPLMSSRMILAQHLYNMSWCFIPELVLCGFIFRRRLLSVMPFEAQRPPHRRG